MALLLSYKLSLYVLRMDPLTCNATFRSHFRAFPGIGLCLETFLFVVELFEIFQLFSVSLAHLVSVCGEVEIFKN
jgi:hypothetical protein